MSITAGLDVGGAHLKVALVEKQQAIAVEQIACPLWLGIEHLERALAKARTYLARADTIAVTMTGELSDLFTDRREGVATLVGQLIEHLGPETRFWMASHGFGDARAAVLNYADVASTNFLATAACIARRHPEALLIDMGSTTTDIVPILQGKPAATGLTDAHRLVTQELIYTGLTRTAVMAVATRGEFKGQRQGLCREYFATMADVHRILGALPAGVDQMSTADGRGKSVPESVARLARMFGRDAADGTAADWRTAAAPIADTQLQSIEEGCRVVLARMSVASEVPFVLAGIGAEVVAGLAKRLGHPALRFGDLTNASPAVATAATHCAPAVAVALLAAEI